MAEPLLWEKHWFVLLKASVTVYFDLRFIKTVFFFWYSKHEVCDQYFQARKSCIYINQNHKHHDHFFISSPTHSLYLLSSGNLTLHIFRSQHQTGGTPAITSAQRTACLDSDPVPIIPFWWWIGCWAKLHCKKSWIWNIKLFFRRIP